MDSLPRAGEMEAIFADEKTVREVIAPFGEAVSMAAFNGPTNIVISGSAGNASNYSRSIR